ncbi:MAG: Uma2 family endonuclease [Dehalococcoidia bacterium]
MTVVVADRPPREHIEPGCDLVDGVLVERNVGGLASFYAGALRDFLGPFVRRARLGVVLDASGGGYQYPGLDGGRLRIPDLSFIRRDRLQDGLPARGWTPYAPDLVVEAISPNDLADDVHHKVQVWLDAGVPLVWVLYPDAHQVVAHHPDRTAQTYSVGDTLTAGDVVPGFAVAIADIFAAP